MLGIPEHWLQRLQQGVKKKKKNNQRPAHSPRFESRFKIEVNSYYQRLPSQMARLLWHRSTTSSPQSQSQSALATASASASTASAFALTFFLAQRLTNTHIYTYVYTLQDDSNT